MLRFCFSLIIIVLLNNGITFPQSSVRDSLQRLLEQAPDDSARAAILIALARDYSLSDYVPAMKYADLSVRYATKTGNNRLLLDALNRSGDIHMKAGLFDAAAIYFSKSLNLASQTGNIGDVLIAYINMSAIFMGSREFTKSSMWCFKAMHLAEKMLHDRHDSILPVQAISIYNNLSIICRERGNYPQSIKYNDLAIQLCRSYPDKKRTLLRLLVDRGRVLIAMKNHTMAEKALQESFRLSQIIGDSTQAVPVLINLGRLYYDMRRYDDAIRLLTEALGAALKTNDLVSVANTSITLSALYKDMGQPDSALKYLTRYQEDDKKVKIAEASREMMRQELINQYRSRELAEKAEHDRKIRRSQFIQWITALTTVLFIVFFALTLTRNKKIRLEKIKIELAAQKINLEKALLQHQLEQKDNQLAMKAMADLKRNEIISDAVEKLISARKKISPKKPAEIGRIIHHLEKTKEEKVWEEFDIRFQQTQEGFYNRLHKVCPGLSANERRLCSFLRMNMSTKEISAMTGQSILSIHKSRNRLRAKLNITNQNVSLVEYIAAI